MKKYFQVFKVSLSNVFEYRTDIGSSFLMYLLGIGFSFFLWHALMKEHTNVGNYNLNSIMTYYLLTGIFIGFFNERTAKHFENWISEGSLAQVLIKPVKVATYLFSKELGQRMGIVLIGGLISILPILFFPSLRSVIDITLLKITIFAIFSILSNIFLFIFFWTIGVLSFWLISTRGIRNVTVNLFHILKGSWFPLDLAPQAFQNILSLLPFQYAMFYPIKILTSDIPMNDHLKGITVLVISIILFAIIANLLWRKGIKSFSSVGI